MTRIFTFLAGLFRTFGGLILYWVILLAFGVRPAIAAALLFVLIDGAWRLWRRRPIPPMWWLANGAAVAFGLIDLVARTPFMIRYDGAIMNLGMAAVFAAGAFGREPMVLRIARERSPDIPDRPEVVRFFRAFTLLWAAYGLVRAGAILWIMAHWPLVEAIAIRSAFGWVSLGVMLLISINGRRVFDACQRVGLFRSSNGAAR